VLNQIARLIYRKFKGYYAALEEVERLARRGEKISPSRIQKLHALVMGGGSTRVKPTPYRDGQNIIRDSRSRGIVYMPPELANKYEKIVTNQLRKNATGQFREDFDLPNHAHQLLAGVKDRQQYQDNPGHPLADAEYGNRRCCEWRGSARHAGSSYALGGMKTALFSSRQGREQECYRQRQSQVHK
jgi:hypothetical protein